MVCQIKILKLNTQLWSELCRTFLWLRQYQHWKTAQLECTEFLQICAWKNNSPLLWCALHVQILVHHFADLVRFHTYICTA